MPAHGIHMVRIFIPLFRTLMGRSAATIVLASLLLPGCSAGSIFSAPDEDAAPPLPVFDRHEVHEEHHRAAVEAHEALVNVPTPPPPPPINSDH